MDSINNEQLPLFCAWYNINGGNQFDHHGNIFIYPVEKKSKSIIIWNNQCSKFYERFVINYHYLQNICCNRFDKIVAYKFSIYFETGYL